MEENKLHWKVLESEYLHQSQWLIVKKEKVELPNSNIIPSYYTFEYPDWVNTIAVTKDEKFVLVKQYRHWTKKVNYELCAGICEKGELPLESAKRELLEETGYGNGSWKEYMVLTPNSSTHSNRNFCFLATEVEEIDEQKLEDTEELTVHVLTKDEVIQLLKENKIIQALMAAPLWKYMAENN